MVLDEPAEDAAAGGAVAIYGKPDGRRLFDRVKTARQLSAWSSLEEGRSALGVPWMTDRARKSAKAIPPAYTQFIGEQFLAQRKVPV